MRLVTRKRCNRSARPLLCFGLLAAVIASGVAHADEVLDTAHQARGAAPRLELELGPQFAWGVGHACRTQPQPLKIVATTKNDDGSTTSTLGAAESCSSGFGLLGGEAHVLLRPVNHWAFGPVVAYDAVIGAHRVDVDSQGTRGDYVRHSVRLSAELRWYSRKIAPGGLFLAFKAGVLWWSDKLERVAAQTVTQSAPQLGLEVGGMFVPYRGVGMTLALQSWLAILRDNPTSSSTSAGSTYGYGPFVFLGVAARLALSLGLR